MIGRVDIDGRPVLAMEYLEGCDLEVWLEQRERGGHGLLALDDVCRIMLQLCYALDGVHRAKIVHRDLKPSNVYIVANGPRRLFLKVLDFGIAKLRADLRVTGLVTSGPMGTLAYMAPEQANAPRRVDRRADIWALGCILYRILTGRLAFMVDPDDGLGVQLRERQVAGELPPPPSSIRRDVDAQWDAIVARCLQVDPDNRYPDVQMLATDIIKAGGDDGVAVFAEVWPGGFVSDPDAGTVRNAAAAAIAAARNTPPPPAPPTNSTLGSLGSAAGMIEPRGRERTSRWPWVVAASTIAAVAVVLVVLATRSSGPSEATTPAAPAAVVPGVVDAAAARVATPPVPIAVDAAVTVEASAAELAVDAGVDMRDERDEDDTRRRSRPSRRTSSPRAVDAGVPVEPPGHRFNPHDVIRPPS